MPDIIFACSVYDFCFICNTGGIGTLMESMFGAKHNHFVSEYEKPDAMAQETLDELTAAFAEAE